MGGKKLNIYFPYRNLVFTWCVPNLVVLPVILRYGCLMILFWSQN